MSDRWLTYRQSAQRVERSVKTIKRWRRHGMPMKTSADGRKIVHEEVLLAWYRQTLANWPIHQQRMRKLRREHPEQFDTPTLWE